MVHRLTNTHLLGQEDSPLTCELATDCVEMLPVTSQVFSEIRLTFTITTIASFGICQTTNRQTLRFDSTSGAIQSENKCVVPASNKSDH